VGKSFTVRFGKVGAGGQTQRKDFLDEARAHKEYDKLIAEKTAKGYRETTAPAGAPAAPASTGPSLREALELALAANPQDRAAHSAYADFLSEQGDPRGEFIGVQLALEDESLPSAERDRLRGRERELLTAHQREWLGGLARFLLGRQSRNYEFGFARGWLHSLHVVRLTEPFARALAAAPQTRLLRSLLIDDAEIDEETDLEEDVPVDENELCLYRLAQSPYLSNLAVLQVGEPVDVDHNEQLLVRRNCRGYLHLVRRSPRLEELYLLGRTDDLAELFGLRTLTHLRVLQVYHQHDYPLDVLAANPACANLTTLLCHPAAYARRAQCLKLEGLRAVCRSRHLKSLTHLRLRLTEVGDEGCAEIVRSGILKRLKVLDLNLGSITDKGARQLARCPDLRHLDLLDLGRNALSADGVAALQATGVRLRADDQHGDDEREWFCIGDIE
jgi:uncharacterized protein (TIGR02996 family)